MIPMKPEEISRAVEVETTVETHRGRVLIEAARPVPIRLWLSEDGARRLCVALLKALGQRKLAGMLQHLWGLA